MRVFVYFNLHKKCYSIKALDGADKGRVICHATDVLIRDAQFRVSEAGRQRVIATGRKNVHAGIVGTLEAVCGYTRPGFTLWIDWTGQDDTYRRFAKTRPERARYNPYEMGCFEVDGVPIHDATMVYLGPKMCVPFNPLVMPH